MRSGRPTTRSPIARVIADGELINVVGSENGEPMRGVSRWYRNIDDDYIWATGAVETSWTDL